MLLRENRDCSCDLEENNEEEMCMNKNIMQVERRIDCQEKEEMLQNIRCYEFAITELGLYLDTHPDDRKALCLHRKYCNELKRLEDMYQKVYGPLTIKYPCNKWRWLEEPWPWEGGEN